MHRIPMLKCDRENVYNGVKVEYGFTLINLHQNQHQFERESYNLASQAKQVFCAREHDISNWYVLLRAPLRGIHELEKYDKVDVDKKFSGQGSFITLEEIDEEFEHRRYRDDCKDMFIVVIT